MRGTPAEGCSAPRFHPPGCRSLATFRTRIQRFGRGSPNAAPIQSSSINTTCYLSVALAHLLRRLTESKEWQFFAALPRADPRQAWLWWAVLIIRGLLPALF